MKYILLLICLITFSTAKELIVPIPQTADINTDKVNLGKKLFFDTRLSKDNTIACVSCHDVYNGGSDNKKVSIGVDNKKGSINSPTVLNSKFNFVQFWDGRAKTLKDQAQFPILNHVEMDSNFDEVISKLSLDKEYVNLFSNIYNDIIKKDHILDAIAEFEKTLITPDSKFDKFLKGDKSALNNDEKKGYELFKQHGCIACHNGVNIGSNLYQKIGIIKPYIYEQSPEYFGLYNLTKDENDKYYFKVPTLRNIHQTSPYLHDGSLQTLKEVITVMLEYQVGTIYTDEDVYYLEIFLKTLTGKLPEVLEN